MDKKIIKKLAYSTPEGLYVSARGAAKANGLTRYKLGLLCSEEDNTDFYEVYVDVVDKKPNRGKPFIYRFISEDGELVYIGKTVKLSDRMYNHLNDTIGWQKDFKGIIEVVEMESNSNMSIMEMYLIAKYKPKYNKRDCHSDETSYTLPEPKFKFHSEVFNGKLR